MDYVAQTLQRQLKSVTKEIEWNKQAQAEARGRLNELSVGADILKTAQSQLQDALDALKEPTGIAPVKADAQQVADDLHKGEAILPLNELALASTCNGLTVEQVGQLVNMISNYKRGMSIHSCDIKRALDADKVE